MATALGGYPISLLSAAAKLVTTALAVARDVLVPLEPTLGLDAAAVSVAR